MHAPNTPDKRETYQIVMDAIRKYGIENVRNTIYGELNTINQYNPTGFSNESIAMSMFINTRQARKKLITALENLGDTLLQKAVHNH